jgi:hypothetical protein
VTPATELDQRLQAAMRDLLVETPAGFGVRGGAPRRQALLSWQPCLGSASQPPGTDS